MQLLAHPFRVLPSGRLATVEQGSDTSNAQLVAILALTRLDERQLEPGFGTSDPTFTGFDVAELAAQLAVYGPDVDIGESTVGATSSDGTQLVQINFT